MHSAIDNRSMFVPCFCLGWLSAFLFGILDNDVANTTWLDAAGCDQPTG
jgi:hypothetical protein